jgi:hypothetical protein
VFPKNSIPGWIAVILLLAAGLALRLEMLGKLFQVNGDSLIYGSLAKNLLLHGSYSLNDAGNTLYPSLIRLPGYPLFLALCFRLFGMENYFSASVIQIVLELLGCLLLADSVRRLAPAVAKNAAALATLALAALCPFTASYAAAPLTETPTLFVIALALWAAIGFRERQNWTNALLFTFAITSAAFLRPDGALVGVALAPALFVSRVCTREILRKALVCLLLALAPFVAWSIRNWTVFHVFQPLAPRYATEPDEDIHAGWQHWIKSWCSDFSCTYDIYWSVPDEEIDLSKIPAQAFDSPQQYQQTAALIADYNSGGMVLTRSLDARFGQLAQQREQAHPLRFHLGLPLLRTANMWFRPRIENLPIDFDWQVYKNHKGQTIFSWAYVGLNVLFLLLGLGGLLLRPRFAGAMLAYFVLRSALLTTIEAPEARYTLECFPMLFVLGGLALAAIWKGCSESKEGRKSTESHPQAL